MAGSSDQERRGLDPALRERVAEHIGTVTDALDAAIANPTETTLDELHAAADKLMRALGRVLIEVERQRGQQPSDR